MQIIAPTMHFQSKFGVQMSWWLTDLLPNVMSDFLQKIHDGQSKIPPGHIQMIDKWLMVTAWLNLKSKKDKIVSR